MNSEPQPNNKMVWTGRIISVLVILPLAFSAVMKVSGNPAVAEGMSKAGVPLPLLPTLAILEAVCIILYAIPVTSIIGAILVTGYMGGVIYVNLRMGANLALPILIPVLAWGGLYLREPRLRNLIPLKK